MDVGSANAVFQSRPIALNTICVNVTTSKFETALEDRGF